MNKLRAKLLNIQQAYVIFYTCWSPWAFFMDSTKWIGKKKEEKEEDRTDEVT